MRYIEERTFLLMEIVLWVLCNKDFETSSVSKLIMK